ncbi:MAG: bifunctional 3-deoxy-7-phosphoheptulonate synthase/chorismate mutase type II [Bacteroidales bacterium]|nr:bifunctional 3-deoxy-7-phosphoheptulonate synthase/chorismate mutase type II [Bacteroidales bacterium]
MQISLRLENPIPAGCNRRPFVMAGPCSAETEQQVMETARPLAAMGVGVFRAGLWKPRTRPDSFEGVGAAGLPWLQRVKTELGLPVAVEVASVRHVEEALNHGIDVFWLGARTTANPFAVQEITEALRGTDVSVWVKNPINPDVDLWIGALERLNRAGITRLGAVHRGFSAFGATAYRNVPYWQIPIELHRRIPELRLLVDPSHIGGSRDRVAALAQYAMNLDFDGLMVEVHCCPERALSDAAQQLTPDGLQTMLQRLRLRRPQVKEGDLAVLQRFRDDLTRIDDQVLELLARRMSVSDRIGRLKKENNVVILQRERWNEVLEHMGAVAREKGLSDEFVMKLYDAIHAESIERQQRVMEDLPEQACTRMDGDVDNKLK